MSVLEPGSIFGRDFRIVRALRSGGMGAVYIADQISTGKQRALKVMAPELAADPDTRERFVREARAASMIESDHVVEIVTAGVDDESDSPYLVMELLKGEELADCLDRTGPLPLGDVAEILQQIGHALEQAHRQGIVHRDLKPENIFICASRRRDASFTAKILDFGIAKLVAESQKTGTQPLGTPLFMAPEQTDRRGRICPATDVWALGLIAFRLLTGQSFWLEGDSLPMLLREICIDQLPFASARVREKVAMHPTEAIPPLPPGFDAWFSRCVNRDIDARFQDAGEAVRAFAELVAVDAPRGVLTMTGVAPGGRPSHTPGDPIPTAGAPAASRIGQPVSNDAQTRPQVVVTGDGAAATNAATIGVTGTSVVTGVRSGSASSRRTFTIAAAAIAVVGAAVFLGTGGWPKAENPTAPSGAAAAPSAPSSAMLPAAAKPAKSSCPEGSVLITGGKMFMGARDLTDAAKPPHEVSVATFCLDRTEVTVKAYTACVDKGECERPLDHVSWPKITPDQVKRFSPLCNAARADRMDHPINCVAWGMANTFCKNAGRRLPTEAEWEYAARGSKQRKYPWGDEAPSGKHLNACGKECKEWGKANGMDRQTMYEDDDGFPATAPVGSFPAGASSHGILDLAGNVWEWTADWFAPYGAEPQQDPKGPATGTQRVLRGGDFLGYQADWARPAYRWSNDPETYNHAIGFRCAADPS